METHCPRRIWIPLIAGTVLWLALAGCGPQADRSVEQESKEVLARMEADAKPGKPSSEAPAAGTKAAPAAAAEPAPKPDTRVAEAKPPPAPEPPKAGPKPAPRKEPSKQPERQIETPKIPAPKPAPKTGEVSLSLLDAIRYALASNHDIQIAAYEPPRGEQDVVKAKALFDPAIFLQNQFTRSDRPVQSSIDTGSPNIVDLTENRWTNQYGIRKKMITGGTVSLYQGQDYLRTNSRLTTPNPQYVTNMNAELKAPLLKGFGDLVNRAPIRVANLNADISFQQFRQKIMEGLNDTVATYWQLAFDLEALRVAQETLDLAREVLRREEVRRKNGISNDLSVNRAQSAVSTRQAEVVRSGNRARNSMDKLKLLMNTPELPLDSEITVVPTEKPEFYVFEVDRSEAVAKALINRPEIQSARKAVAINQIRADVAKHERLPKLDALLRYTMNGLGTRLGEAYESEDPGGPLGWIAGLEFELPLGNRDAASDWRKRLIEYHQSLLEADRLAAKAIQEVNLAVRSILYARDEVEATLKAKMAAELTVKGEFARFELGQTSNYELLQAQDALAAAERDYLQALSNFNLSLSELTRAQGTLLEDRGIEIIRPEGPRYQTLPLRLQVRNKGD